MTITATPLTPNATRLCRERDLYLCDTQALPLLLDARTIRVVSLNPVGRAALPGLVQDGVAATASRLAPRFAVPEPTLRRDLAAFAAALAKQGLLPGSKTTDNRRRALMPLTGLLRRLGRMRLSRTATTVEALRPAVGRLLRQAWLDLRLHGWTATLSAWRVNRKALQPIPAADAVALVCRLVQEEAAGQWLCACACKERALVAAYLLECVFGLPATIVIGLITVPFQMHAWATAAGTPLTDDPDRIALFPPLVEYRLN